MQVQVSLPPYGKAVTVSEEPNKKQTNKGANLSSGVLSACPRLKWCPASFWALREILQYFDEVISEPHIMKHSFPKLFEDSDFKVVLDEACVPACI